MVTVVLMMDSKVAQLLCFFFFYGQYLPSLNTNYLAINKDMELRLPQLYYMDCMKLGFLKTVQPNSFSKLISAVCNFKNIDQETYLFVSNL